MAEKVRKNDPDGYQDITEMLKSRIASKTLRPGERLVERRLCEAFGVQRGKIREALRQLQQDGFVKITPNVGASVTEFSQKDIEQIYDLLAVLEGLALRICTPFITGEQCKRMEALVNKMEATDKPNLFYRTNIEFHSFLNSLSENDRLIKLIENLRYSIRCAGFHGIYSPGQIEASIKEHRKIVKAVAERNAIKAELLMRNHLVNAKNRLLKYMNKSL